MLGHDDANNERSRSMNFGVVDAANDFIDEIGCEFPALNTEAFPTYILSKDTSFEAYAFFVTHALRRLELVAKIGIVTQKNTSKPLPNFLIGFHEFFQGSNNLFVYLDDRCRDILVTKTHLG